MTAAAPQFPWVTEVGSTPDLDWEFDDEVGGGTDYAPTLLGQGPSSGPMVTLELTTLGRGGAMAGAGSNALEGGLFQSNSAGRCGDDACITRIATFRKDVTLGQMQRRLCSLFHRRFPRHKACLVLDGLAFDHFDQRPMASVILPPPHSAPVRASTPRGSRDDGSSSLSSPPTASPSPRCFDATATVVFMRTDTPVLYDVLERLPSASRRRAELLGETPPPPLPPSALAASASPSELAAADSKKCRLPPLEPLAPGLPPWTACLQGFASLEDLEVLRQQLEDLDPWLGQEAAREGGA